MVLQTFYLSPSDAKTMSFEVLETQVVTSAHDVQDPKPPPGFCHFALAFNEPDAA